MTLEFRRELSVALTHRVCRGGRVGTTPPPRVLHVSSSFVIDVIVSLGRCGLATEEVTVDVYPLDP